MKNVAIYFSFDNNYVVPAAVAFESLLSNANIDIFFELFVLHADISTSNQNELEQLVNQHGNAKLSFVDVSKKFNFDFNGNKFSLGHGGSKFTIETLYRCLPSLIPEFDKYDRIIYSDVDIVVVDDISPIFDVDLDGKYMAGVRAPAFLNHQIEHLGEKYFGSYLSGGLWVVNLQKMRQDNLSAKICNLIENPPVYFQWPDQDIMNIACDFKVGFLPYQYISIPSWKGILEKRDYLDEYYPNNELYRAMLSPKIIHYAAEKPWSNPCGERANVWFYWLKKTKFAHLYPNSDEKILKNYQIYLFNTIPLPLFLLKAKGNAEKIKIYLFDIVSILRLKIQRK